MWWFVYVSCGIAQICLFDPTSYGLKRTQSGCIEFVRQINLETNGWGPLDAAKVCRPVVKPGHVIK